MSRNSQFFLLSVFRVVFPGVFVSVLRAALPGVFLILAAAPQQSRAAEAPAPMHGGMMQNSGMVIQQSQEKRQGQDVISDTETPGQMSISYLPQNPGQSTPVLVQLDTGLTRRLEVAVAQATAPGQQMLNAKFGLLRRRKNLISTGFMNWSTLGMAPQPFLEARHDAGNSRFLAGGIFVVNRLESLLSWGYQGTPRAYLEIDYQSGSENDAVAGVTYSVTPTLGLVPAIHLGNGTRRFAGFLSLTWNVQIWK